MNKVRVQLGEKEYTVVTERDEAYVRDCADRINYEMTGLRTGNAGMRVSDAALLCAMNFLDELGQVQLDCDQLKRQLKECFEESARQRGQLDELEKTVAKLTQELEEKKAQLARKGGRKSAPASQGAQAPDEGEPAKE